MTYSQLYIKCNINNQVTIGLQNTHLISDAGKSAYLVHNQIAERQIEKNYPLESCIANYRMGQSYERYKRMKFLEIPLFLRRFKGKKIPPLT